MAGIFTLAGLFAALAGLVLLKAIDALRWGERRELVLSVALLLPLAGASAGAFWLGAQNPRLSLPHGAGFGPDWECTPVAKGGPVCIRHAPK